MTSSAKRKGTRVEIKIVKLFQCMNINARRQPLSGALAAFPHDVQVDLIGGLNCEVKARKNGGGFTTIKKWKGSADLLILVEDYEQPGVYMDWVLWKEIAMRLKEHE